MKKVLLVFTIILSSQAFGQVPDILPDGVIIGDNTSDPTGFREGFIYWNSISKTFRKYDGTTWSDLSGIKGIKSTGSVLGDDLVIDFLDVDDEDTRFKARFDYSNGAFRFGDVDGSDTGWEVGILRDQEGLRVGFPTTYTDYSVNGFTTRDATTGFNTSLLRPETPIGNSTFRLPAKAAGIYTIVTTDDLVGGSSTFQDILNNGGFAQSPDTNNYINAAVTANDTGAFLDLGFQDAALNDSSNFYFDRFGFSGFAQQGTNQGNIFIGATEVGISREIGAFDTLFKIGSPIADQVDIFLNTPPDASASSDYYLPLQFTDGTTTIQAGSDTVVDLSTLNLGGGGSSDAASTTYNNADSNLSATNVKDALDELDNMKVAPPPNDGQMYVMLNGEWVVFSGQSVTSSINAERRIVFDGDALTIPTYDANPDVAHPSVLYFDTPWNGYNYWMAFTPYPLEARENPSIVASNDGLNWVEPVGITNPVEPQPVSGSEYNSDTEIFYSASEDKVYLVWRFQGAGSQGNGSYFYYRESTDGINWTNKTEFFFSQNTASPTIVLRDGVFTLWYVDIESIPFKMKRKTAATLADLQNAATVTCDLGNVPTTYSIWHIEVNYDEVFNQYVAALNFTIPIEGGAPNNNGKVAFATSMDGITFDVDYNFFNFSGEQYRASFVRTPNATTQGATYELFYNPKWRVHKSFIYIKPETQIAQAYDSVEDKLAGVFGFRYRLSSWYGMPVAQLRKISTDEIQDVYPVGANGLKLANGTLIDDWTTVADLELLKVYNQASTNGDYIEWSTANKPSLTKTPWNGTEKWGWTNIAADATYSESYTNTVDTPFEGVTATVDLQAGKIVSTQEGAYYFGLNGSNLTILRSQNHSTPAPTEPSVLTGIWGTNGVIRINGVEESTGTTGVIGSGANNGLVVGAYNASGTIQDYLEGNMTELVTWEVQPLTTDIEVVENQMLADYPYDDGIDNGPPLSSFSGNLIAHYEFDETTGTVVDETGNNNGTITGSITRGVTGQINNAFDFNGDAQIDTGITTLGNEFTVTQWVNTSNTSAWESLWSKSDALWVYLYVNALRVYVNDDRQINHPFTSSNTWVHVALTVKENGFVRLYVDGVKVDEYSITTVTEYPDNLIIGRESTRYYNYLMDDFRIYNAELSQAAITELSEM